MGYYSYFCLHTSLDNMKSKIIYNPYLSVKENAENNGVSVAAVRWYIKVNGIDRKLDNAIIIQRRIEEIRKENPNISIKELSVRTGYSVNTIKKRLNAPMEQSRNDSLKLSTFDTTKQKFIIKSISRNQTEILSNILQLYVKAPTFDCDLTYSIGNFYLQLPKPQLKFDKFPQMKEVKPLEEVSEIKDNSLHSVVIDLPFIITYGKSAKQLKIAQRFNSFPSLKDLYDTNTEMLILAYRILRRGGYLIMKTMDFTFPTKQVWVSNFVQNKATELGFTLEDTFILVADKRPLHIQGTTQRHARKFHSYFFVLKK